jgi:predicted AlkP superfamily pyrophosphatase or phosphodiesterase
VVLTLSTGENNLPKHLLMAVLVCLLVLGPSRAFFAHQGNATNRVRRNVIIFVADGLRAGSMNERDTPALWAIRTQGVQFTNSHSLFPTFTTANASAIATGHGLGDTGDFSNTIWVGYPIFDTGNFNLPAGTPTPFVENDQILSDLAAHYNGNYLSEATLLTTSARNGYNTVTIGKLGPTAIQQIEAISTVQQQFPTSQPRAIFDDATGTPSGVPLPAGMADELTKASLSTEAPTRSNGYGPTAAWNNGNSGNLRQPGTRRPNAVQQQWFADIATRVVLPAFQKDSGKPFLMLFWCRDPDGTQHNQGDSLGTLYPGINGESSRLALQNADRNLRQILDWLDANTALKAQTDILVTSDHGFATISRQEIDRSGKKTASEAAKHIYVDAEGAVDTAKGTLPNGFLAIDLALGLKTNLFDPDRHGLDGTQTVYREVKLGPDVFERPSGGNGLLGEDVRKADGSDATAIVAANGGSDLIYVPDRKPDTVRKIVGLLTKFDYVGAIFVDDQYGPIPGALPLSAIGLVGSSPLPRPAIVVGFKVFYLDPNDLQTAIQISDTSLQEGQGMHGGFGRDSTFNNMAAIGPDFKVKFSDRAPVSNADIAPTIAHILGFDLPAKGKLVGRVIVEALRESNDKVVFTSHRIASTSADGWETILHFQELGGEHFYDRACFVAVAHTGGNDACP